ncbi:MAG: hypothetical protein ACM3XM_08275 [Mycobacterium leprae]
MTQGNDGKEPAAQPQASARSEYELVSEMDGRAATGANTAYGNVAGNTGFRNDQPSLPRREKDRP